MSNKNPRDSENWTCTQGYQIVSEKYKDTDKAKDIEKCIEWLIEDKYTTGQIISINGGWGI